MTEGPYTTITVEEYNNIVATHTYLRWKIQKARELLEHGAPAEALVILKIERDTPEK